MLRKIYNGVMPDFLKQKIREKSPYYRRFMALQSESSAMLADYRQQLDVAQRGIADGKAQLAAKEQEIAEGKALLAAKEQDFARLTADYEKQLEAQAQETKRLAAELQKRDDAKQPSQPVEPPILAQIRALSNVSVGEGTIFLPNAQMINPRNLPVRIGKDCMLSNYFIFESDQGQIDVGNRVFINSQTQIISRNHIIIEDNVVIAWGCMLYDHNSHSLDPMVRRIDIDNVLRDYRECGDMLRSKDWSTVKSKPIRICKDAWLGFNVIVLAGVTIGEGAVIGAGSVVREDVPPYAIAYGNPAQVVGYVKGYPKC